MNKKLYKRVRRAINFLGKCMSLLSDAYGIYLAVCAFLAWFAKTDIFKGIFVFLRMIFGMIELACYGIVVLVQLMFE